MSDGLNDASSDRDEPRFRLYNTLTREVEDLDPEEPEHLRFYTCGPTVYSYAHIGNFRSFLTSDLILRTARALGWETTYVTNITDVGHLTEDDVADSSGEDRMAKALRSEEGQSFANVWDLAEHYARAFVEDWHQLNLREPDVRPKATQHIREQILAVDELLKKGYAYETDQGVYFDVDRFEAYGKLSGNRDEGQLEASDRDIVRDPDKRSPRDFALWKKDTEHLMQWHSPFGWGFPGWHIECSVMGQTYLGDSFDLHTGGEDLIFPHHECEIAQSEALSDEPLARYWAHTRFLQVEGEKMSKSKGNFYTVRNLIRPKAEGGRGVDPLAVRYELISGHYRKQLNFTFEQLEQSAKAVRRYRDADRRVEEALEIDRSGPDRLGDRLEAVFDRTLAAMADDLNTPKALAHAFEGTKAVLAPDQLSGASARSAAAWLDRINELLGIVRSEYEQDASSAAGPDEAFEEEVEALLDRRARAREEGDFEEADRIRDELEEMGVEVMDTPDGTEWRRTISV